MLRHPFCKESRCKICLSDHEALQYKLNELTNNDKHDHLGKYRLFLERTYPEHEWGTEWGWAHPDTFLDEYIQQYVRWFKNKYK